MMIYPGKGMFNKIERLCKYDYLQAVRTTD